MLRRLEWRWSVRIALVVFVTADLVGVLVALRAQAAVTEVHEERAAAIARGVERRCHRQIADLDVPGLRRCLDDLWEEPGVSRVAVEGLDGEVVAERSRGGDKGSAHRVRYASTSGGTVRAFVVVDVAEDLIASQTARARAEGLVAAVAFTLIGIVLAVVATRRVVRPIRELAEAETAIARGDLTARVPIDRAAELRELAEAFNGMVEAVAERDSLLRARGDELAASLDEVRSLAEAKRSLTAMIVHDLRSPIAAAISVIDVVDRQALAPEDRELVDVAGARLRSGLALAGDLLDVSRLEGKELPVARDRFDLATLCRELAAAPWLAPGAERASVALDLGADQLPIVGDRRLVERSISNLLANAARHAGAAGKIRLGARFADGLARIEVEDRGPGVAPEDRERIFRPFERGSTERGEGAGLGLALCAMVAAAHGGRIRVEDASPGARFVLELPAGVA